MYEIDLMLEEGEVGKYRVIARVGLTRYALTDWHRNRDEAFEYFTRNLGVLLGGTVTERIDSLEQERKERVAGQAAQTRKLPPTNLRGMSGNGNGDKSGE